MIMGITDLPTEILRYIAEILPVQDVRNVRLTCKYLGAIAERFLLRTLWISPAIRDQTIMLDIANHESLSTMVEVIKYDASTTVRTNPRTQAYFSRSKYIKYFQSGREFEAFDGRSFDRRQILRGYQRYKERQREENQVLPYSQANMTRPHRSLAPSELVSHPRGQDNTADDLPSDLLALIKALPRFPRLKTFILSDCRYRHTNTSQNRFKARHSSLTCSIKRIGNVDAIVLDPQQWPAHIGDENPFGRHLFRGLTVLTQAASVANSYIRSFEIERASEASGVCYQALNLSESEMSHVENAFRHSKRLRLCINSQICHPNGSTWCDVISSGQIARVLTSASALENLDIRLGQVSVGLYPSSIPTLEGVMGVHHWSYLRVLRLENMTLARQDLLTFMGRQSNTIRSLCLTQVIINCEDRFCRRSSLLSVKSCGGAQSTILRRFGDFNPGLTFLHLKNEALNPVTGAIILALDYTSSDPMAIKLFLRTAGSEGGGIH
jgi:hypothetical protein